MASPLVLPELALEEPCSSYPFGLADGGFDMDAPEGGSDLDDLMREMKEAPPWTDTLNLDMDLPFGSHAAAAYAAGAGGSCGLDCGGGGGGPEPGGAAPAADSASTYLFNNSAFALAPGLCGAAPPGQHFPPPALLPGAPAPLPLQCGPGPPRPPPPTMMHSKGAAPPGFASSWLPQQQQGPSAGSLFMDTLLASAAGDGGAAVAAPPHPPPQPPPPAGQQQGGSCGAGAFDSAPQPPQPLPGQPQGPAPDGGRRWLLPPVAAQHHHPGYPQPPPYGFPFFPPPQGYPACPFPGHPQQYAGLYQHGLGRYTPPPQSYPGAPHEQGGCTPPGQPPPTCTEQQQQQQQMAAAHAHAQAQAQHAAAVQQHLSQQHQAAAMQQAAMQQAAMHHGAQPGGQGGMQQPFSHNQQQAAALHAHQQQQAQQHAAAMQYARSQQLPPGFPAPPDAYSPWPHFGGGWLGGPQMPFPPAGPGFGGGCEQQGFSPWQRAGPRQHAQQPWQQQQQQQQHAPPVGAGHCDTPRDVEMGQEATSEPRQQPAPPADWPHGDGGPAALPCIKPEPVLLPAGVVKQEVTALSEMSDAEMEAARPQPMRVASTTSSELPQVVPDSSQLLPPMPRQPPPPPMGLFPHARQHLPQLPFQQRPQQQPPLQQQQQPQPLQRPGAPAPTPGQVAHARQVREACLTRYREKKARRSYGKTIRYAMRKVNADRRPRVKGRFVKAAKGGEQQAQHEDEHAEDAAAASPQQPLPPEQQQQQEEEPAQEAGAKGASEDAPAPME